MSADWLRTWAPGAWIATRQGQPACIRRADDARLAYAGVEGEARFPVLHDSNGLQGLLLCVSTRGPGRPLPASTVVPLRLALARLAGRDDPGPIAEQLFVRVPDEVVLSGRSLELAGFVALGSALLGRRPAADLCFSAAVNPDGLGAVEGLATKQQIVEREVLGGRLLGPEVGLRAALTAALGEGWEDDLHAALGVSAASRDREALAAAMCGQWEEVKKSARPGSLADHWYRGLFGAHEGDPAAAAHLAAAGALVDPEETPYQREELIAFEAVARFDQGDQAGARAQLEAALGALGVGRSRRWKSVATQVSGSLRRVLHGMGDLDGAIAIQRSWGLGQAALPEEQARCQLDLAHLLRASGDLAAARQAMDAARRALPEARDAQRPMTARFVALQESRLGIAPMRRPREAAFPAGFLEAAEQAELFMQAGAADAFYAWLPTTPPSAGFALALACFLGEGLERLGHPPDLAERCAALRLPAHLAAALGTDGWRRLAPY